MQAPLSALRALRRKYQYAVKAADDTFQSTKNLFEKHNVVFTVAGGLLSAGAAWAGYTARQVHQKKLEQKLQKIEEHMTNVYSLEEQQVKALTTAAARTGVSYQTFLATSATALLVGYALGFRGGRRFVIRRIPSDLLLAAKKQRSSKQSGLARLLPGRSATKEKPEVSLPQIDAPATFASETVTEAVPQRPQADSTSIRADPELSTSGNAERSEFGEHVDDGGGGGPSSSSHQKEELAAGSESNGGSFDRDRPHVKASQDKVDAALGETTFERQVERVMRPEREAGAHSSEDLDKILQATIPNLDGGTVAERKGISEEAVVGSSVSGLSNDEKSSSSSSPPEGGNQTHKPNIETDESSTEVRTRDSRGDMPQ